MARRFVDEFHRELNRQASAQDARRNCVTGIWAKTEHKVGRLIEAIKAGVPGTAVKDEMKTLEARRSNLIDQLKKRPLGYPECTPTLLPNTEKKSLACARP